MILWCARQGDIFVCHFLCHPREQLLFSVCKYIWLRPPYRSHVIQVVLAFYQQIWEVYCKIFVGFNAAGRSLSRPHCTKHIDVRFNWIREAVSIKQLNIIYISTAEMAADALTKGLPAPRFLEFRRMIGVGTGS